MNFGIIVNSVQAIDIGNNELISVGDCGSLLTYKGIARKVTYIQYFKNGVYYPAYCLDKNKKGVETVQYSVSVQNVISDVNLWKIIINGYPYKTIEELGCCTKEEAFTATKQAIYCYIHGNNPAEYGAIGTAGQRTLNALHKILRDAENCNETQISNIVKINKLKEKFEVDENEKQFVSKIYSITTGTEISNYNVKIEQIENELPEGIKITDLKNNSKTNFNSSEQFKILIPIKNLTNDIKFNIKVETQMNTKPVLYGKAPDSSYQDYALTGAIYEDSIGNTLDICDKNETKIKIIKQDEDTKKRLENVEFCILDENKEIIYANIKTDSNGEIQIKNIVPGKYYLQETNANDGYIEDNELKEFSIKLNEELTITINNKYEKKIKKTEIEKNNISQTAVRKLPVTGM